MPMAAAGVVSACGGPPCNWVLRTFRRRPCSGPVPSEKRSQRKTPACAARRIRCSETALTPTRQVNAEAAGELACRPGSVHPLARADGHPSRTAVAGSLVRSTREHRVGHPRSLAQARRVAPRPSDLAPGGVYRAAAVTCGAGGLLHHRFTLTPGQDRSPAPGRSAFCGTFPRVTPGRRYRPPCPAEPGPSSPGPEVPARPPGRLARRDPQHRRSSATPDDRSARPTRAAADARCR